MQNLKDKKIHFIGIGGVGVNALAGYAIDCGAVVSGSDAKYSEPCRRISQLGAFVYEGLNPDVVNGCDAVVYTSAIKDDNAELARARELKIPVYERQQFLRRVASGFKNIVGIAGTHGKTTTTAMLAHILASVNKKFVAMIGGNSVDYGNYVNNSYGENDVFLAEACEYKRNFLTLKPTVAVVTNVECDHPDCYSDYKSVKQAFDEYLLCAPVRIFLKSDLGKAWEISQCDESGERVYKAELESGLCRLYLDGIEAGCISLSDGGDYNYKNASFAIIAATALGIEIREAIAALGNFKGVCRRFELAGKIEGVPIYFDFAHHPTEISCVLERAAGFGKILAVFQPHTYSRTKAYFENFVEVFGVNENIGALALMPTYAAREKFDAQFEVDALARAISEKYGKQAFIASDTISILDYVCKNAKDYDIVLFIGAGDIYDIKPMLKYDA